MFNFTLSDKQLFPFVYRFHTGFLRHTATRVGLVLTGFISLQLYLYSTLFNAYVLGVQVLTNLRGKTRSWVYVRLDSDGVCV